MAVAVLGEWCGEVHVEAAAPPIIDVRWSSASSPNVAPEADACDVTTYTYDHAGRETSISFAQGSTSRAERDSTRDAKAC